MVFYGENTYTSVMACIRTCTLVSLVTVTLFAGPAKLIPEALKDNLVMSLGKLNGVLWVEHRQVSLHV